MEGGGVTDWEDIVGIPANAEFLDGLRKAKTKSAGKTEHRRGPFQTKWVAWPRAWYKALLGTSLAAWELAAYILFEEFKQRNVGGEIVLSPTATGMPSSTVRRAARVLVDLGLVEVEQTGLKSMRVMKVKKLRRIPHATGGE